MKHTWSVLCQNYFVDKASNNLSLIEIPDRITFGGNIPDSRPFELRLPSHLFLVSTWARNGDEDVRLYISLIRVLSPTGDKLGQFETTVDFEEQAKTRTIGKLDKLPFTENGVYHFQVCSKESGLWIPVASIPLEIIHEQPEKEESEPD